MAMGRFRAIAARARKFGTVPVGASKLLLKSVPAPEGPFDNVLYSDANTYGPNSIGFGVSVGNKLFFEFNNPYAASPQITTVTNLVVDVLDESGNGVRATWFGASGDSIKGWRIGAVSAYVSSGSFNYNGQGNAIGGSLTGLTSAKLSLVYTGSKFEYYDGTTLLGSHNVPSGMTRIRYNNRSGFGRTAISGVRYGLVATPILLGAYTLGGDYAVTVPFSYTNLGAAMDVPKIQLFAADGVTPVSAKETATVIENTTAGSATIRSPSKWSSLQFGSNPQFKIYESVNGVETGFATGGTVAMPLGDAVFGQNVANDMFDARATRRTLSNMMMQSQIQLIGSDPQFLESSGPKVGLPISNPTLSRNSGDWTDNLGNPLKISGASVTAVRHFYPVPDEINQQVTIQMKWTGGPLSIAHSSGLMTTEQGVISAGAITLVSANTLEWTLTCDRSVASGAAAIRCAFDYMTLDTSNPPKNMTMIVKGVDDLSLRYKQSMIDFYKLLPGRLRFMDGINANGPSAYEGNDRLTWANRNRRDNGIAGGLALEDMIEICNRSNRPLWWNISTAYAYETGGVDHLERATDMLFYGIGADFSTTGVVKHIGGECGNENWNGSLGNNGYLLRRHAARTGDPLNNDGAAYADYVRDERNYVQEFLISRVKARVPEWASGRFVPILGCIMQTGLDGLDSRPGWDAAKVHVQEVCRAPYLPNDPTAGGSTPDFTDKTPEGIVTFLRGFLASVSSLLGSVAASSRSYGFAHSVYEVNVSIVSLRLTIPQKKALCSSQVYYDFWYNEFLPALAVNGGSIAFYSDRGQFRAQTEQEWTMERIPNSIYNKQWDAAVAYAAAHPVTVS